MITLKDVALAAGVSISTASHVLSGKGEARRVSPATQKKVLDAANQLNYHPNTAARSLRDQTRCPVFAFMLSAEIVYSNFSGIINALRYYQEHSQNAFEFGVYVFDHRGPRSLSEKVKALNVQGVLLATPSHEDVTRLIAECPRLPIVLLNRSFSECDCVYVNAYKIAQKAVELFALKGHRHVALIDSGASAHSATSRFSGFKSACAEYGMTFEAAFVSYEDISHNAYHATLSILSAPRQPTAIFYGNDEYAIIGLRAFHDLGVSVPQDVELLAYGAYGQADFSRYTKPSLSTAYMPCRDMVKSGIDILLSKYNQFTEVRQAVESVPEFQFRESFVPSVV